MNAKVILKHRLTWLVLAGLGIALVGAGGGYLLFPPRVTEVQEYVRPHAEAGGGGLMPDVLGLPEDVARRAIGDAGISGAVTIKSVPAAGQPGRVMKQSPAVGDTTSKATLAVSAPTTMPKVVGLDADEARDRLEALGAVVIESRTVAPKSDVHTVLATTPATGKNLTSTVTFSVAFPGDALNLTDIRPVDGTQCSEGGDYLVGGVEVQSSMYCEPDEEGAAFAEYALSKRAQLLQARVGIDDRGTATSAKIRIFADGRLLKEFTASPGQVVTVDLPVGGVVRLRLEARSSAAEGPTVVFGDLSVLGIASALDALR